MKKILYLILFTAIILKAQYSNQIVSVVSLADLKAIVIYPTNGAKAIIYGDTQIPSLNGSIWSFDRNSTVLGNDLTTCRPTYYDLLSIPGCFYREFVTQPLTLTGGAIGVGDINSPISIALTEIDPTVQGYIKTISGTNITNWNTTFSWGNWATQGLITSAVGITLFPQLSGSYSNPTWITDLPYTKITGTPALNYVTSVGLTSNELSITGTTITSSGTFAVNLSVSGVTAGTYRIVTVNNKGIVTSARNPTINVITSSGRNFDQAYLVSSTAGVDIRISVSITCTLSLAGGTSGNAILEYSANGSTGWLFAGHVPSSNTGALTIGLNTAQIGGGQVSSLLPTGYYWRLRTNTTSGTPTYTLLGGQEIIY